MKLAVQIAFFLLFITEAFSSPISLGNSEVEKTITGQNIEYAKVEIDSLSKESLNTFDFKSLESNGLTLPNTSKAYLLKIDLEKVQNGYLVLSSAVPYFDEIRCFQVVKGKALELKSQNSPFPTFAIPPYNQSTIYFAVKSSKQYNIPLKIYTSHRLDQISSNRNMLVGAFLGIMICMLLYNIVIGFYTKQQDYISYILYIVFITLAQVRFLGVDYYFGMESLFVKDSLLYLGSALSGIFGVVFAIRFLNIKELTPRFLWMFRVVILVYIATGVIFLLGFSNLAFNFIQLGGILSAVVFLISCITLIRKKYNPAKIYLAAWSFLMVGLVVSSLRDFGILDSSVFVNMTFPLGVAFETILLSLALANRITILEREKDDANKRVIEEVKRNEELVINQNTVLEQEVAKRTEELETALSNLKETQTQLVQSEKMASLGVLTAGIAHEINNPINFVTANVIPLRENIEMVTEVLNEYKNIDSTKLESELNRIKELEKQNEIEELIEETDLLINGIEEGAKRTHSIVEGLKTFSRGDRGLSNMTDLNTGILSTVSVLNNRFKGIALSKTLADNLPLVKCQIGKMNQVFLNILANALDAVDKRHGLNSKSSHIEISTSTNNGYAIIKVKDNGEGMPKEVLEKVFEPFYTTKDIGKGTGLGLSISYGIIEEHNGELIAESKEGEGSVFTIKLPL